MQLIDKDAINWNEIIPDNPRQLELLSILKIKHFIEKQPIVDAEPVVYGEWVEIGDGAYKCSVCKEISCCTGKYCPDCGAKMKVKDNAV